MTVSKRKLIVAAKYNLLGNWQMYISSGAAVAVNLLICIIISIASGGQQGGGSIDAVMLGMAVALGAIMCANGLKFALINGVSRRTHFISTAASVLIAAFAYALATYLLMLVSHSISHTSDTYYFLYCLSGFNWAGILFYEFGLMLFSIALGYFAAIVMYRTRRTGKLVMIFASAVIAAIIILISFFVNIWPHVGSFFLTVLGYNSQNPFIGMASLTAAAALLLGGIFLIVRRADIRG